MGYKAIIANLMKLLAAVADYFRDKQLLDAGKATQRADDAEEVYKRKRRADTNVVDLDKLHPPEERDK